MQYFNAGDGLRLAYDDKGQGTPLLCLPGLTRNMDDFEPVVDAFADKARIIRLDFRGRGGSDYGDPMTYTIPQEAQDTLALLDHLGLEQAAILGTSRGGLVAMAIAGTVPGRLSGAILNDIGPEIMPEGLAYIMDYIGRAPRQTTLAEVAAAFPIFYADSFRNVSEATWAAMARRLYRQEDGRLALRYDPRLRDAVAASFDPDAPVPDLWPLFDAFAGKPLGLIRGAGSNILSAETAAEMRRRRPDMLFAELEDRGHVPFLDEPECVDLIDRFLKAL